MFDLRAKDYQATPAKADLRSHLGAMVGASWIHSMIARGYGWHADVGAFSTPIQGGGAGTILDQDQPELIISAPTGYTIVPLRIHIACQVPISAADSDENEILLAVDRAAKYANDGSVTSETPTNMRTDIGTTCPLTVASAATGNITNPTLGIELGHAVKVVDYIGTPANGMMNDLVLLYEPANPPFLVGPCAIYGYFGGTVAVTGFINADFLAIPSALITSLT